MKSIVPDCQGVGSILSVTDGSQVPKQALDTQRKTQSVTLPCFSYNVWRWVTLSSKTPKATLAKLLSVGLCSSCHQEASSQRVRWVRSDPEHPVQSKELPGLLDLFLHGAGNLLTSEVPGVHVHKWVRVQGCRTNTGASCISVDGQMEHRATGYWVTEVGDIEYSSLTDNVDYSYGVLLILIIWDISIHKIGT